MPSSPERDEIARRVRAILAGVLDLDLERITPSADLVRQLGMTSLQMIETNIALERALGVTAPEVARPDELGIRTVDDLIEHAHRLATDAKEAR